MRATDWFASLSLVGLTVFLEPPKTCPERAESVKAAARKCRFCGHSFAAGGGP
jgi:hypothetical protein